MVHSGQPCGCGLISSFFSELWEPGSASTGRGIWGHFTLGESQSRLFLAASPPNSVCVGGGGSEERARVGEDANKSPEERKGELGRLWSRGKVIYYGWFTLIKKDTRVIVRASPISVLYLSKVLNKRKLPQNETRMGLVTTCCSPSLDISSPTFSIFQGPNETSSWSPSQLPKAGPIPPLSGPPQYSIHTSRAAHLIRCFLIGHFLLVMTT